MAGGFYFENRLFRIAEKAVNLIKLNILWILFSLPLVTGGAALCALHVTAEDHEGGGRICIPGLPCSIQE